MIADLFGPLPRAPRRKLMQIADAGNFPDGRKAIQFVCGHCGFDEGWTEQTETDSAAKRGRPCIPCKALKEPARG